MLYGAVVALTMYILPPGSLAIALARGQTDWIQLTGEWFVFWPVGVRVLLAGLRQYFQPQFTSLDILKIESADV